MSRLRRFGGTRQVCFLTCVTYCRRPILADNVDLFWTGVETLGDKLDFEISAYVILPDHFHILLDPLGNDFAGIMQRIKMSFGMLYRQRVGRPSGRIWQHRYWDHVIRDEIDLNRHIDYIHYNPVKHGLVSSPFEWKQSSLHEYYESGAYDKDWGLREVLRFDGRFGE